MRHAEITESPCKSRNNGNRAEASRLARSDIKALEHVKISVKRLYVFNHFIESADNALTEAENDKQSNRHYNALNKVRRRGSKESAERTINNYNGRAYNHRSKIVHSEQIGKKLAACRKSRSGIGDKEYNNKYRRDKSEHVGIVAESL